MRSICYHQFNKMENIYIFYLLLFIVAFLYSSVGHGGASGYLALMAIYAFSPEVMKPTALMLNLFVSLTSFIQFYRGKHFKWNIFLPLALASIPMAFIGGLITMEADLYKKIVGLLLLIPVIRFLFFKNSTAEELKKNSIGLSIGIGSVIGLISGLIGIGKLFADFVNVLLAQGRVYFQNINSIGANLRDLNVRFCIRGTQLIPLPFIIHAPRIRGRESVLAVRIHKLLWIFRCAKNRTA